MIFDAVKIVKLVRLSLRQFSALRSFLFWLTIYKNKNVGPAYVL